MAPLDPVQDSDSVPLTYCQPCQEDNVINTSPYTIKLPEYSQTLMTALQSTTDFGVYATFDPDTEQCVVDNCANVHIWNEFSDFIPTSYMKINTSSAVNGESNLLTRCGDVPVE